jgi:hypothetical protein
MEKKRLCVIRPCPENTKQTMLVHNKTAIISTKTYFPRKNQHRRMPELIPTDQHAVEPCWSGGAAMLEIQQHLFAQATQPSLPAVRCLIKPGALDILTTCNAASPKHQRMTH